YGVSDHNFFEVDGTNHSGLFMNGSTNGHEHGSGSWADFPYYGSDKFWFVETNTMKGFGLGSSTSAGLDSTNGGRWVARHNYWDNGSPGGHGTEGANVRGTRATQVYNNTFYWSHAWG